MNLEIAPLRAEQIAAAKHTGVVSFQGGRGIVTSIYGGEFASGYVLLRELARHGVKLPVEVWHREGELSLEQLAILREIPLDVTFRLLLMPDIPGYAVKVAAVCMSAFREVLWLDSDNFPVRDPSDLFDDLEYQSKGSLFWRDVSGADRARFWHPQSAVWAVFGVPYNDAEEFDTGIFLVDKSRCAAELALTMYFNRRHAVYYQFVHGDKDTFRLAWQHLDFNRRKTMQQVNYLADFDNVPYGFMPFGPFHVGRPNPWRKWGGGSVMVQRDRYGRPLTNHQTINKFTLPRTSAASSQGGDQTVEGSWSIYGPPEGEQYDSHLAELARRLTP